MAIDTRTVDKSRLFHVCAGRILCSVVSMLLVRATRRERARSRGTPSRSEPVVLAFDTAAVLRAHAARAAYSTFNTGSTVRGGKRAPRDEHSFRPVAQYRGERAAELVVAGGIEPALLPPG